MGDCELIEIHNAAEFLPPIYQTILILSTFGILTSLPWSYYDITRARNTFDNYDSEFYQSHYSSLSKETGDNILYLSYRASPGNNCNMREIYDYAGSYDIDAFLFVAKLREFNELIGFKFNPINYNP